MGTALIAASVGIILVLVGQLVSNHVSKLVLDRVESRIVDAEKIGRENYDFKETFAKVFPTLKADELQLDFAWALDAVQTTLTLLAGAPLASIVLEHVFGASDLLAIAIAMAPLGVYVVIANVDSNAYAAKSQRSLWLLGRVSPGFFVGLVWYALLLIIVCIDLGLQLNHCSVSISHDSSLRLGVSLQCRAQ
ncbi:hypothetical protein [Sinomonas sp. P47F7]|uniref:hypothetical protein n=1 Tax=Sinomonas sp. P47F7 TaxID=3410987 RepID=UPI003BF5E72F